MQVSVLEYVEATAAHRPDKIALVDGDSSLSFARMMQRASAIATLVADRIDETSELVAVLLPKSADAVVSFLGILMSGNCYLPLDVKFPAARVRTVLETLEPRLVITARSFAPLLRDCDVGDERVILIDDCSLPSPDRESLDALENRRSNVIDTDPVYVIVTSGSTGVPKGVAISHRSVIDYIDWARERFDLDDSYVIGSQAPFCFDNSTLDLYLCFATGSSLVLIPEELFAFPVKLMEFVARNEISFVFWVPAILMSVANLEILDSVPAPSLRAVFFAGEVMPNRHLNYWRRHLPDALFVNLYGPTEITVDCTYFVVDREFGDDDPLPIGYPCRNTDVVILKENDELCSANERGELCVRGSSLALGYWNDAEKTAAAFVQNPFNSRYPERIYRTGDLVWRDERGEIYFAGRKDDQIKHLGYRIELAEIEHHVLQIAGLADGCVLYDKEKREIALFYESSSEEIGPGTIRRTLSVALPKYMLPTAFHRLERMPRTVSGKVDRNSLSAMLGQPGP